MEDAAAVLRSGVGESSSGSFVAAADQWPCPLSDGIGGDESGAGLEHMDGGWVVGSLDYTAAGFVNWSMLRKKWRRQGRPFVC